MTQDILVLKTPRLRLLSHRITKKTGQPQHVSSSLGKASHFVFISIVMWSLTPSSLWHRVTGTATTYIFLPETQFRPEISHQNNEYESSIFRESICYFW